MADQELPPIATTGSPRTWLINASLSPLAVRLIRQLLSQGDCIAACLPPSEMENDERSAEFRELLAECSGARADRDGWEERIHGIRCDGSMSGCGSAVAEAVERFGQVDVVLCCRSEALVGTVEEFSTNLATQNLVREQFETIFFSQVNFIKAALPQLRSQHSGHIIVLTSVGGHIATPHMAMYSSSTWALEGFCDSLTYEVAPFNIRVTIVQPNQEIPSLTNRITFAPQIPAYANSFLEAPTVREMFTNVLNLHPETAVPATPDMEMASPASPESPHLEPEEGIGEIFSRYPRLPPEAIDKLVSETIHAITAIGGLDNPPSRHIVGPEGATAVQEKLKTITEEMEDFVEASLAVDIFESELTEEAREGKNRHHTPT